MARRKKKNLTATEKKNAMKSLHEERMAVSEYSKRLKAAKSNKLRKAFEHALPEERTHAKLFLQALRSR